MKLENRNALRQGYIIVAQVRHDDRVAEKHDQKHRAADQEQRQRGIGAQAEQAGALSMSRLFSWKTEDVALICLCYVEYATPAQIRYAVRRVRRRVPDVLILVALFGNTGQTDGDEGLEGIDFVQQSLGETVDRIMAIASKPVDAQGSTDSPGIAPAA